MVNTSIVQKDKTYLTFHIEVFYTRTHQNLVLNKVGNVRTMEQ
jgi:hypothetical protein